MSRKTKSIPQECATQRFSYAEIVKEDALRNPKATGPNSYVCTKCGYWHVRTLPATQGGTEK